MEIMLDEQENRTDLNHAPPDVVHSTEAGRLMHMINYERSATHGILNQIDSSVNTHIGRVNGSKDFRNMSSDSEEGLTPNSHLTPNSQAFGYSNSQAFGYPNSQNFGYHQIVENGPPFSSERRADSISSLSSVSTVSSEAPMMYQAQYYQQQQQRQEHKKQYQHVQTITTTTEVRENPVVEMATAEMKETKYYTSPVVEMATAEYKSPPPPPKTELTRQKYLTHLSAQLVDNGFDMPDTARPPDRKPPPSPDVNQMSLQSVREAMAVSLTRMRELEEQVKAIPILQVRISVLKEEKRLLNLQLKASKANNKPPTRSVGVMTELVEKTPPPTLPKPRSVDEFMSFDSTTETFSQMHTSSSQIVEQENYRNRIPSLNVSFQQPYSLEERESRFSASELSASPRFTINQIQRNSPKPLTRSIGTGDGNVFEGSSLQIHEKELRTVFIGQSSNVAKRNVGIECRPSTRDVGVSFMVDEEKPETRTIGVNVNCDMSSVKTSLDFKGETELRMALAGVLRRNVRSVATNCNFKVPTRESATAMDVMSGVSVGCGDEEHRTDVEIRMPVFRKAASVTAKPETGNKCVNTEKGWTLEACTNTPTLDKFHKSSMTEKLKCSFAATNTEVTHTRQMNCQTETTMFLVLERLKHAASNTDKTATISTGMETETTPVTHIAVNTVKEIKPVSDVANNTETVVMCSTGMETEVTPCKHAAVNTVKEVKPVSHATSNTEQIITYSTGMSTDTTFVTNASVNTMKEVKPLSHHAANNTERITMYSAAVETEATPVTHASVNTMKEVKPLAHHAANNTDKIIMNSRGMETEATPVTHVSVNTLKDPVVDASVNTLEIEPKVMTVDRGVGEDVVEEQYMFSETWEEVHPVSTVYSMEEQIVQRGAAQANSFLTSSKSETQQSVCNIDVTDQYNFLSAGTLNQQPKSESTEYYEVIHRDTLRQQPLSESSQNYTYSSVGSNNIVAPESVSSDANSLSSSFSSTSFTNSYNSAISSERSSSEGFVSEGSTITTISSDDSAEGSQEKETKTSIDSRESKPSKEDDFSRTVVEHFIITDGGKTLVSKEVARTVTVSSDLVEPPIYAFTADRGSYKSPGSPKSPLSYYDRFIGNGLKSSINQEKDSNKGDMSYNEAASVLFGTKSSAETFEKPDPIAYRSHSLTTESHIPNLSMESNLREEKSYNTVVTNPYKTVENLAAASSLGDSDSVESSISPRMSKTSSEGNIFSKTNLGRIEAVQSLDTIYDMRRAGSVEDFMPDDIRKYMSIDPSTSKDSGFGEDLLQRFSENSSSSSTISSSSSEKARSLKSMLVSTVVTTKRTTKSGDKVLVQETKTTELPDGQKNITFIEMEDGQTVKTHEESVPASPHQNVVSEEVSSSTQSFSFSSSSNYAGDSKTRLTDERDEEFTSSGDSSVYSETNILSGGIDNDYLQMDTASFESVERKIAQQLKPIKPILKHSRTESDSSSKKGISFAETVKGGTDSSSSEEEDDDSESTASYEEGCYDSQEGAVIYSCRDDETIAQGTSGAQMFDQNIRETYELLQEVREACKILSTYLIDSTTIQTKQLNASLNVIQQEWFQVSSHKLSSPHQVEDFLSSVNEISKRLLEYIVNMTDANGNTAIHYCISHCNFEIANLLMDSEVCGINRQNKAGYTPIMLAGLASLHNQEQREIVRRLFSTGDINARAPATMQTALMLAASHGRTDTVRLLTEEGADLNLQDVDGSTALMCACEHGHLDIVTYLLAQPNIDAHITDNENSTALTIAMEAGHKDVGVVLYRHLNFTKASSPGIHRKRKSSSSPTPSVFGFR